ncbi:MAG: glycyl-radical enzyme activating protein [Calditrichota bacterium]
MATKGYIFNLKKYALNCSWCHNPESRKKLRDKNKIDTAQLNCIRPYYMKVGEGKVREVTVPEVMDEIQKDRIFYEDSGGGITCSGGEPLLQIEFLTELLQNCKQAGIHTVVDTSGYASWSDVERITPLTDLFLFDLKLIDDKEHLKYTGVSNKLILDNLKNLSGLKKEIYIRIPLIPEITDLTENLEGIASYLKKIDGISRIDLLPYNPMGLEKYKKLKMKHQIVNLKHQSQEELQKMWEYLEKFGFQVNIEG